MHPVPYDLYRVATRKVVRYITRSKQGGPVQYFKNVHPTWDCQPWQDGYAYRYGYFSICEGRHDEMSSRYFVSPFFLKAVLYESAPFVMRWPR